MVKYDVQTLMALSQNGHIEFSKFSNQAYGNNLLRPHKPTPGVLSEQSANRRNASGLSRQSVGSTITLESNMQPSSNPRHPPPLTVNTQFDPGFVRFVKNHTSPKHQRVTAGGRIVPMDPSDSPPKWTLPLSQDSGNTSKGTAANPVSKPEYQYLAQSPTLRQEINNDSRNRPRIASLPAEMFPNPGSMSVFDGGFDQPFSVAAGESNLYPILNSSTSFLNASAPSWVSSQTHPQTDQQSMDHQFPVLADYMAYGLGDTQVANSFQGVPTQAPTVPPMPPVFQPQPNPTTLPGLPNCNSVSGTPQVFGPYPPNIGPQWPQAAGAQMPSFNQQFLPPHFQDAIYQKSSDDAQRQHELLSAQLSHIDRFTALHSWNIDPERKKALVEVRKSLVRELDTVRLYKEHLQMLFGKSQMNAAEMQKGSTSLPVPPAICVTNSSINGQFLQGPSFACPGSTPEGLAYSMPATTVQQPFPISEPGFTNVPWQTADNPSSPWAGNLPPVPYNTFQEPSLPIGQKTIDGVLGSRAITPSKGRKTENCDRAVGSNRTSPSQLSPDFHSLYRKIEENERQGKPIEGLLNALSGASKSLARRLNEERKMSLRSPSKPSAKVSGATIEVCQQAEDEPKTTVKYIQPVRHSRRVWRSDDYPENSQRYRQKGLLRSSLEDSSMCSSSFRSKADSWTTTHEEEKWWLDRELKNCRDPQEKTRESSTRNPSQYLTVPTELCMSSVIDGIQSMTLPSAPVESSSATSTFPADSIRQSIWQSSSKSPFSPLLGQYFNKNRSPILQKTAAPAVSQNVNAHAFLPPFDGAGATIDGFEIV
ncbi:hypothetical protein ARAM_005681 [Aspergillus rambellii]|uniref:Uncharacterized protein n=2 Tax=Aspergillus subgen. Nidulantes TaxID=2720870 RepID=A0A0F8XU51_9EURO|nr:hypothetical protein ARAM_005681 [Aspergillus rambellii]